jgi:hypothetical protein
MGVVSDPHTGPLHARVKDLLASGNLVCLGQDDCCDAYYPFGQCSMHEVGFLRLAIWLVIGLAIYFGHGMKHSVLGAKPADGPMADGGAK